ncbi:8662_t:CDS:2, partial [Gigaspora margarita]
INDPEHITKLNKCKSCRINEDLDTAVKHCTFRKQLRSKKRALQNNWLKKAKEANEFWLEVLLESIIGKKHHIQKLVIKKGANGKKYDKKVQESMFGIMKQEKTQPRLEMIRGVISIEREVKEGIAKDNKRKPQTAKEISDPKSSKKQKGKEKQITQLETNSIDPQPEQQTLKVKRRVNKENQDPLRK